MMSTSEHLSESVDNLSSDTSTGIDSAGPSDAPLSFRPHHYHHLRPQDMKHTDSFSSMSSYASSQEDENENEINERGFSSSDRIIPTATERDDDSSETEQTAFSATSKVKAQSRVRRQELQPGGGTPLRPAGKAQDWYSGGRITSHGRWFRDTQNRTLLMRGVNMCGNSKLPTTPNGSSHLNEGFFDHRNVCFLGRPFPRDQADEHFSRLRRWGLTGIYDDKFIDSLIELIELMPQYGIKCFIDPHQDCWSRFSGGSGAPGWTFEAAGLDLTKFKTTGAAYVHNTNQFPGDSPPMVWPTNYTKLAASTMFTLFWAGDTFAPNKMYQGEPIQQFLQNRYVECYQHLARRLSHLDAIVGYEVMNEPHPGYVGLKNMKLYDFNSNLFFGDSPSALESFALGDGMTLPIGVWVKSWPFPTKKERTRMINTEKDSAWLEGECLWKQHGVWSVNPSTGQPQLDRPDYFTNDPTTGEKVEFTRFYLEFVNRYSKAIQSVVPSAFIFVGPIPNEPAPVWRSGDHEENIVYAPHWYDLHSVFNKAFDGRITHDVQGLSKGKNVFSATYFGIKGAKRNYRGQVANVLNIGLRNVGNKPCLIGECGIPMDINQRQAFLSGDYGNHSKFLDAVLSAMEANLLSFTLWNYNTTNDNTYGDHWNGEDFSIFSLDSPQSSELSDSDGSQAPSKASLRQQAPNFAKEVMRRAAAQNAEGALILVNKTDLTANVKSDEVQEYEKGLKEKSDRNAEVATVVEDDSPFDRSYFCFDHEELDHDSDHIYHVGGRALDAVVRPYAAKVAGEPIASEFDFTTLQYTFRFCNYFQVPAPVVHVSSPEQLVRDVSTTSVSSDSADSNDSTLNLQLESSKMGEQSSIWFGHPPEGAVQAFETEIFIPAYHYNDSKLEIQVSDGDWRYVKERQTLYYRHKETKPGAVHSLRIRPVSGPTTGMASTDTLRSVPSERDQTKAKPAVAEGNSNSPCVSCGIM
ncbi:hypothetical protein BGX28_007240 [Mortierella sp. GBA30]|nr:hypothetical protein BGX28_007240 [Mortierella sp. GBA30]